uniref:Uncharacterized protein n=1 Tax=viral metagenome TaxID=1070528 RepID=A0A6H1ZB23_9ZZZZ
MSIHTAMKNRSIESLDEKILEANARRICHCVNTYDELLESLIDCKDALGEYLMSVEDGKDNDAESAYQFACHIIKKATREEYE